MSNTAMMAIKIASGVAVVVIAAVKIVKERRNKAEAPETKEEVQTSFLGIIVEEEAQLLLFSFVTITTRIVGKIN